jgi:hypothetical protein
MELHLLCIKDDGVWRAYCLQTPLLVGEGRGPDSCEMDLAHDIAHGFWEKGKAIFGETTLAKQWKKAEDMDNQISSVKIVHPETKAVIVVKFSKRRVLENDSRD